MVTIKDVAKQAGVSVSAVSKALNGYPDISRETREKVMQAAEKLNYFPNLLAKNLKQKVTRTLALILANFEHSNTRDGNVFQVMYGVHEAAKRHHYEVITYTRSLSQQQEKSYWQLCKENKIAGAVVTGLRGGDPYLEELVQSGIPCAVLSSDIIGPNISSVMTDNNAAAQAAVNYLIERGHREIGMIGGNPLCPSTLQRLNGYEKALEEAGIGFDPERVLLADYSEEKVYEEAEVYLGKNPDLTAVFAASDLMAIGLMRRCRELQIRVPEDLSVFGFDGIVLSGYTTPGLTTVKQDFFGMGSAALEQVIHMLELQNEGTNYILPYEILERESVGYRKGEEGQPAIRGLNQM